MLLRSVCLHSPAKSLPQCLFRRAFVAPATRQPPRSRSSAPNGPQDRRRHDSLTRYRRSENPTEPYTRAIMMTFHGMSIQIEDVERMLAMRPYTGAKPPLDHVLRRDRIANTTIITLLYETAWEGGTVREILSKQSINGVQVRGRPMFVNTLLEKYDPVHVSPQSGPGKVVSIEGFPYAMSEAHLRIAFAGYELVDNHDFQFHLVRQAADLSIWLVRTKSEDEAQRIVKTVNSTYYYPQRFGNDYPLRAEVFY